MLHRVNRGNMALTLTLSGLWSYKGVLGRYDAPILIQLLDGLRWAFCEFLAGGRLRSLMKHLCLAGGMA